MTTYCKAPLNYSGVLGYTPTEVTIRDGRAALDSLAYEDCGFTLVEHRSAVEDWRDDAHVAAVHGPEIESLATQLSGCDRAIVYPPLIRSPEKARTTEDYAPIEAVHSDFTEDYLGMVREPGRPYRKFLDPLLERAGLSRQSVVDAERVLLLQFWRNVGPERPDRPLAVCDASTVPRSQLRPFPVPEYGGLRLEFETFGVLPPKSPDDNAWYTFPGLNRGEAIAFRTYDSRCAGEGRPFWTPHSAFRDPNVAEPAPRRESVEMRALCLFGV